MATPVLLPWAAYTVMVGRLTLNAPPPASPDSGLGLGTASGAAPGQISTCSWPGEGCQGAPPSCACAPTVPNKKNAISLSMRCIGPPTGWPVTLHGNWD